MKLLPSSSLAWRLLWSRQPTWFSTLLVIWVSKRNLMLKSSGSSKRWIFQRRIACKMHSQWKWAMSSTTLANVSTSQCGLNLLCQWLLRIVSQRMWNLVMLTSRRDKSFQLQCGTCTIILTNGLSLTNLSLIDLIPVRNISRDLMVVQDTRWASVLSLVENASVLERPSLKHWPALPSPWYTITLILNSVIPAKKISRRASTTSLFTRVQNSWWN